MPQKKQKQYEIYDYLNWRGDLSYENVPLCEVDNLIFSLISYVDFDTVVPERFPGSRPSVMLNVTKQFLRRQQGIIQNMGLMISREIITLLVRASKTPRFGLVRPVCYVNRVCGEQQKQFSAISFLLPTGDVFVAFRGTDDTLIGWKENFNMCFMHPVPAQTEALLYLEEIASRTTGKIYVGGHSKGGNLAVFAAVKASKHTKDRIIAVYNNDGPGFDEDFIKSKDYDEMKGRIHTLVPQSSVVGMLLEHEERYTVVNSRSSGLLQHNGLSWDVMGGSFIHLDDVDPTSKSTEASIKKWLAEISREERMKFVDALYEALLSTNAKTVSELSSDKLKIIKAWNSMDSVSKSYLKKCINLIFLKKGQKEKGNGEGR